MTRQQLKMVVDTMLHLDVEKTLDAHCMRRMNHQSLRWTTTLMSIDDHLYDETLIVLLILIDVLFIIAWAWLTLNN